MMRIILFCFSLLVSTASSAQTDYSKLVNPFVGTGGHGHTYPGATSPHGMVQLSPDTRLEGWDGCGGYHYDDNYIYGFTHTHLSGTGIPDYCDILLMPMAGKPSPDNKVYGSRFSHASEKAYAGYYSVKLDEGDISAQLTTSPRVGMHHYSFGKDAEYSLILDLFHRDEVLASSLKIIDKYTVTGMRRSKSWAQDQLIFFAMRFSEPVEKFGVWENNAAVQSAFGNMHEGKNVKAWFQFDRQKVKDILVKVALSPVSEAGALANMQTEMPGWSFSEALAKSTASWNAELSKIEVEGDEEKRKIFYTALYHTAVVPCINQDADGLYRGMDKKIHKAVDFTYYSVFSLWDTYRAAHPLYTIIDRKRTLDYIKTFLAHYDQGGRLPVWELASNETDCMIGYHSVSVIADAYIKGIRDFDVKKALAAMLSSANSNHFGLEYYKAKGMIESDDEHESVSRTLEYAYDDFCISMFALNTGAHDTAAAFAKRSRNYRNMIDDSSFLMRPRRNGGWLSPFDPREVNSNYTEANAWQYSFAVAHDIAIYMRLTGGPDSLERRLDKLFTSSSTTTGREQADITGLIGQYAHGNEPSHHIAYLYNFTRAPHKTQYYVNKIIDEFYSLRPDGLIGNEDCGQMSAWYVLSSMGFYSVIPGESFYTRGSPQFKSVKINLENGRKFSLQARGVSNTRFYVDAAVLPGNGMTLLEPGITAENINEGGEFFVGMTDRYLPPRTDSIDLKTYAEGYPQTFMANPVIAGPNKVFKEKARVRLSNLEKKPVYYTLNGSEPTVSSKKFTVPLTISANAIVKAKTITDKKVESRTVTAVYKKLMHNWSVILHTPYEPLYDGGGPDGLVDGVFGDLNWRKGNWQGYQKQDPDIVIDLKKQTAVKDVYVNFLQDTRAWIVAPKSVTLSVSGNGADFRTISKAVNLLPVDDLKTQRYRLHFDLKDQSTRYIRIQAEQFGKLPAWHEGAGGDTHIFIDEIEVK